MPRLWPLILSCALTALLAQAASWGAVPSFFSGARIRRTPGAIPDEISSFAVPTEHNPQATLPILRRAPNGTYVSVGLERSFLGAAITPGADSLLVLDLDDMTVDGTRLNAGLLVLARGDRERYLRLRFDADYAEIASQLDTADLPADYAAAWRRSEYASLFPTFADWDDPTNRGFFLMRSPPAGRRDHAFRNANYFHYESQFARLTRMAAAGKISSALVNLADALGVRSTVAEFKRRRLSLSVLDISDTWWWSDADRRIRFLRPEETERLIAAFAQVAHDDSILLLSSNVDDGTDGRSFVTAVDPRFPREEVRYRKWGYLGVTFRHLRTKRQRVRFLARILAEHARGETFAASGKLDPERYLAGPAPKCAERVTESNEAESIAESLDGAVEN